jgi:hypothetical protein
MQNNDFNWPLIRVTLSVASSRLGGDYLVSPNYGFTPQLRGAGSEVCGTCFRSFRTLTQTVSKQRFLEFSRSFRRTKERENSKRTVFPPINRYWTILLYIWQHFRNVTRSFILFLKRNTLSALKLHFKCFM